MDTKDIVLRGELIMKKETFEKNTQKHTKTHVIWLLVKQIRKQ